MSTCSTDRAQQRCREGDSRHADELSSLTSAGCIMSSWPSASCIKNQLGADR